MPFSPSATFDPGQPLSATNMYVDLEAQHAAAEAANAAYWAMSPAERQAADDAARAAYRAAHPLTAEQQAYADAQAQHFAEVEAAYRRTKATADAVAKRGRCEADASNHPISGIAPPSTVTPSDMVYLPTGTDYDRWRDYLSPVVRLVSRLDATVARNLFSTDTAATYSDFTVRDTVTGRVLLDRFSVDSRYPSWLFVFAPSENLGSRRNDGTVHGTPWDVDAIGMRTMLDGCDSRYWARGGEYWTNDQILAWANPMSPRELAGGLVIIPGTTRISSIPSSSSGVPPSMMATYVDPTSGTQQTVTGSGGVISVSSPSDYFAVHVAPQPAGWNQTIEDAGTPAPVIYVQPTPDPAVSDVNPGTGTPATASQPGTGGGTALDPISGTPVAAAPTGTAPHETKLPTWAIAGVIGLGLYLVLK